MNNILDFKKPMQLKGRELPCEIIKLDHNTAYILVHALEGDVTRICTMSSLWDVVENIPGKHPLAGRNPAGCTECPSGYKVSASSHIKEGMLCVSGIGGPTDARSLARPPEKEFIGKPVSIYPYTTFFEPDSDCVKLLEYQDWLPMGWCVKAKDTGHVSLVTGILTSGYIRLGKSEYSPKQIAEEFLRSRMWDCEIWKPCSK